MAPSYMPYGVLIMNPIPSAGKFDVYKTMLFPYVATSILGRYWEEDAKEMMKVMAPEMSIEYWPPVQVECSSDQYGNVGGR